jgi:tetratricopeptide (TPR) repeat protein
MKPAKEIVLNNRGASYIESGDFAAAINVLTKALKRCQKSSRSIAHSDSDTCSNSREEDDEFRLDSWVTTPCHEEKQNCDDSSTGCVSRRTMRIPKLAENEQKDTMIPLAISFNLALAHQLQGMKRRNGKEYLLKAAELYKCVLAYQLGSVAPISTCIVYMMTIFNNMGHLYRILDDFETSEFFLRKLLAILWCLEECYPLGERPCNLENFQLSTKHLSMPVHHGFASIDRRKKQDKDIPFIDIPVLDGRRSTVTLLKSIKS